MHKRTAIFFMIYLSAAFIYGCLLVPDNQGDRILNEGVALFNKGDCESAKLKFVEAVKKDPKLWAGYYYMAECALKKSEFHESLKMAQKALELSVNNKQGSSTLKKFFFTGGQTALKKEDYDNSILFFKECISLGQEDCASHLWLGKALLERGEKGDMKTAIGEFKAALAKSKDTIKDTTEIRGFFFDRAKKYSLKGDIYTESRCYLAYTENINQKDVDALVLVGRLFLKMGNPLGALYYAEKAYALNPKDKSVLELMDQLNTPFNG